MRTVKAKTWVRSLLRKVMPKARARPMLHQRPLLIQRRRLLKNLVRVLIWLS